MEGHGNVANVGRISSVGSDTLFGFMLVIHRLTENLGELPSNYFESSMAF